MAIVRTTRDKKTLRFRYARRLSERKSACEVQGVSVEGIGCLLYFAAVYQPRAVRQAKLSNVHLDEVKVLLAKVTLLCKLLRKVVLPCTTP